MDYSPVFLKNASEITPNFITFSDTFDVLMLCRKYELILT